MEAQAQRVLHEKHWKPAFPLEVDKPVQVGSARSVRAHEMAMIDPRAELNSQNRKRPLWGNPMGALDLVSRWTCFFATESRMLLVWFLPSLYIVMKPHMIVANCWGPLFLSSMFMFYVCPIRFFIIACGIRNHHTMHCCIPVKFVGFNLTAQEVTLCWLGVWQFAKASDILLVSCLLTGKLRLTVWPTVHSPGGCDGAEKFHESNNCKTWIDERHLMHGTDRVELWVALLTLASIPADLGA